MCGAERFQADSAPQQAANLAVSKKLHKPDFFSLTAEKPAPITPTSNGAARLLLAAEALVQVSGLNDLVRDTRYQFLPHLCGNAEPGFDRDVGSGRRGYLRLVFDIVG